jgi:hypothetical protein
MSKSKDRYKGEYNRQRSNKESFDDQCVLLDVAEDGGERLSGDHGDKDKQRRSER